MLPLKYRPNSGEAIVYPAGQQGGKPRLDSLRQTTPYFRPSRPGLSSQAQCNAVRWMTTPSSFGVCVCMFNASISQLTTSRWELPEEIAHCTEHGFNAISVWRPKLSDMGVASAAALLASAGMEVSSVQWAGGFTGSDGRSFDESVADAIDAIEATQMLGACVLIVHSGCRGGHTLNHAHRLLRQAIEVIAPVARRKGVTLAIKPIHAAAATGCSFLTQLCEALQLVERLNDSAVGLSLDLWQFGHKPELFKLLPRLAASTAVVQVADRLGPPSGEQERLPASRGSLPLEALIAGLIEFGYAGQIEFDPVGEAVEEIGYERVLAETRVLADAWNAEQSSALFEQGQTLNPLASTAPIETCEPWNIQLRSTPSRRSHASSHTVSRG